MAAPGQPRLDRPDDQLVSGPGVLEPALEGISMTASASGENAATFSAIAAGDGNCAHEFQQAETTHA